MIETPYQALRLVDRLLAFSEHRYKSIGKIDGVTWYRCKDCLKITKEKPEIPPEFIIREKDK